MGYLIFSAYGVKQEMRNFEEITRKFSCFVK